MRVSETKIQKLSKAGFTLIELLVVIAIIGLLASIVLIAVNSARSKARDAKRKGDLKEMAAANELYFNTNGSYPVSAGWFTNPNHGGLDSTLGQFMSKIPDDPGANGVADYQYWRKDYRGYSCMTVGTASQYGFYAKLENPTSSDTATISDSFDQCVQTNWGMNYKVGY